MITNAKDIPLGANPGTLPNMQDALFSYFQNLTFVVVAKTIVNFNVVETRTPTNFLGVVQPFTAKQLQMKPEGQRAWTWYMVHATPDLILTTDSIFTYQGVNYRVMQKWDYKEYGYVQYDVIQDFSP